LYALSRYVRSRLSNKTHPFLPLLDKQLDSSKNAIKTVGDNGVSAFYATEAFSAITNISQLRYNKTRYQIDLNATKLISGLDATRMANLSTAYFAPITINPAYPQDLYAFQAGFRTAYENNQWNFQASKASICFDPKRNSTFQAYDPKDALEFSREFCNNRVKPVLTSTNTTNKEGTIFPLLYRDVGGRKSVFQHGWARQHSNTSISFAIAGDLFGMINEHTLNTFFQGRSLDYDSQAKDCESMFKDLIDTVSSSQVNFGLLSSC